MRARLTSPLLVLAAVAAGQVRINEACSKNLASATDGNDFPDWIELHNAGSGTVDLTGLFLSDDPNAPLKWALPAEPLGPDAYLLLFEDDDNDDGHHFDFKLSQEGETIYLASSAGLVLDSLELPFLRADHSFGRAGAGPRYFDQPTPGAANSSIPYLGYADQPVFDRGAGFHPGGIDVVITDHADLDLRYTTNGAEPDHSSATVDGPVHMGSTGTLKAKAWGDQLIPSRTTTATYLINEDIGLPIVSLSMHPDSMFDDTLGLYMAGPEAEPEYPHWGANFWDERGIAVRFEYFDENGARVIDQDLELRIHGGRASRNQPQRPLRLTARAELGNDLIRYPFFPERPGIDAFKRIILRNSGADWCLANYRDGLFHQISLHNGLDIDELGFRPCVTFINGQYWGILNIRERIDEDHLALNYGADRDDLLLMEEENLAIQGDSIQFAQLMEFIHSHDLNNGIHWAHVDSAFDVASFIDYFALEMFAGNADWPSNNLKFWKPSITTGKWRYLMYDMDATMNVVGWIPIDFDMFYWVLVHRAGTVHAEVFRSLMERTEFRRGFLNRLADLMNTALSPEAFLGASERIRDIITAETPRHFSRWDRDIETWHMHVDSIIPAFAMARADIMRADVLEWYGLPNSSRLRFEVFPPGAGGIHINTIAPPLPFSGIYFNGNDIDISAVPQEGYTFDHWTYDQEPEDRSTSPSLRRSFAGDGTITAFFGRPEDELVIFPNPCAYEVGLSIRATTGALAEVLILDALGRVVHRSTHLLNAGVNGIRVPLQGLAPGLLTVQAITHDRSLSARLIKTAP